MMRPGRPHKALPATILPKAEELVSDITLFIDKVMSRLYSYLAMPTVSDIQNGMKQRLLHECNRLLVIRKEKDALADAYNRFVDLRSEQVHREQRVQRLIAVLGRDEYLKLIVEDAEPDCPLTSAWSLSPQTLREELPLWEAMKEFLQYTPEARIAEMEEFFGGYSGVALDGANRQAIESALKRHPETFKTRKKGREKFISLKEKARE